MLYGCERTWSDVVMKRTFDCALYISSWCCYCCCCSLFLFFPSLFRLRFNKFTVLQLPYWFVWMHVWVSCLKRLTWPSAYARAIACECMCACDNVFIWITANIPYVCTYASKVFRLLLPNSNEMRMYWFSMYTHTTTEWTTQCLLFVFRTIFLYPPLVDFKIHFPFRIFHSYRELHV